MRASSNAKELAHKVFDFIGKASGFVFGLTGFVWWLGVTPDMVGEGIYRIGMVIAPLLVFAGGVIIGWQARGIRFGDSLRKRILALSDEGKDLLFLLYSKDDPIMLPQKPNSRFPHADECFQDLHTRGLAYEYERLNVFQPRKVRISDRAKEHLGKNRKTFNAVEKGREVNAVKTIERFDASHIKAWYRASYLEKLITYLAYSEKDESFATCYTDRIEGLIPSHLVFEDLSDEGNYVYLLCEGVADFIDRNKEILDDIKEKDSLEEVRKRILDIENSE